MPKHLLHHLPLIDGLPDAYLRNQERLEAEILVNLVFGEIANTNSDITRLLQLTSAGDMNAADALAVQGKRMNVVNPLLAKKIRLAILLGNPDLSKDSSPENLKCFLEHVETGEIQIEFKGPKHIYLKCLQKPVLHWLCQQNFLKNIEQLSLRNNSLDSEDIRIIANSPQFGNVEHLDLSKNSFGEKGVLELARGTSFQKLTGLNIAECQIESSDEEFMSENGPPFLRDDNYSMMEHLAKFKQELKFLNLEYLYHDNESIRIMSQADSLKTLETLIIKNRFHEAYISDLSPLTKLEHLRELDLFTDSYWGAALSDESIKTLCQNAKFKNLSSLKLNWNSITGIGVKEIASCQNMSSLKELEIGDTLIEENNGLEELTNSNILHLNSLGLASSTIGQNEMQQIVDSTALINLQHLDLTDNPITPEALQILVNSNLMKGLKTLILAVADPEVLDCDFYEKDYRDMNYLLVKLLAESPNISNLTSLNLEGRPIGEEEVKLLINSNYLTNLQSLNLNHNILGPSGLALLINSNLVRNLKKLQIAESLDEYENDEEHRNLVIERTKILASVKNKLNLEYLNISCNYFENADIVKLSKTDKFPHLEVLETIDLGLEINNIKISPHFKNVHTFMFNKAKHCIDDNGRVRRRNGRRWDDDLNNDENTDTPDSP